MKLQTVMDVCLLRDVDIALARSLVQKGQNLVRWMAVRAQIGLYQSMIVQVSYMNHSAKFSMHDLVYRPILWFFT